MKKYFLFALFISSNICAQTLTIEKIMRDPKWIGTSPSNIFWSYNNKQIYFNWNPEKAISDSFYSISMVSTSPNKIKYNDARFASAMHDGVYNRAKNKIVFIYNNDVYLQDVLQDKVKRITQTAGFKSNPLFTMKDTWICWQQQDDVFAWDIQTGTIKQLMEFRSEPNSIKKGDAQSAFLQQQQLNTSDVIKRRKEKKDARTGYLKKIKDADSIRIIYKGDQLVTALQISPDARFITYSLVTEVNAKDAWVPDYVTENGYTMELPARSKAGAPKGNSSFYIFDRLKDTVIAVKADTVPGIKDQPAYLKDYPAKWNDTANKIREVYVASVYWNDEGTQVIADMQSADYKDRWLMLLDAAAGKLKTADRQHDDAWIAGPGIAWLGPATIGWINDHTCYYQSEATGYSHLYTFDINTQTKKQITQGSYEVLQATLSHDKKYFYLITNEEHPGKQHFYRINTDGTGKQKITIGTGGYEITISPDEKFIAYRYSYQNKPWELYVQENAPNKKPIQLTDKAMSEEWKSYPWRDTKIFSFTNSDGLPVYARIYEPVAGKKNNAAVIFVHGAGYLQNVTYSWSYYFREFMFNNLLADKGYTVLDIDYSASAGYGRNWRTAIYRYMGGKDLDDEVDAARMLVKEYGIDAERIGMYGGSYGGFMTLMALFTKPGVFKAGAALRPVTDWAHYADGYSDVILNEPFNDSIAYQRSSPINFAAGLKDHLLICHGMVDVNVHYQDAVRLAQRLIELGKDNWEFASYPVEDHGFVEPSSWTDEYKRILKLFDENLLK